MDTRMKTTPSTQTITDCDLQLQLMVQHERALAELYGLYARDLEDGNLWRRLQREQELHADLLRDLAAAVQAGEAVFEPRGVSIERLQTSLASLRQRTRAWKSDGIDPKEAYGYAVALKESMQEDRFFIVDPADSPFAKEILETLSEATAHHVQRIRHMGRRYLSPVAWFWRAIEKLEDLTAA